MMAMANGTLSFFTTPAGTMIPNSWQHVALTYDSLSDEALIYLNGVNQPLETVIPPEGPLASNDSREILLGNARMGNLAFEGCIDEVRQWNTIRAGEEIFEWMEKNLPKGQAGLLVYWKMNEGAGDSTADFSGHHLNAGRGTALWNQGVELVNMYAPEFEPPEGYTVRCYPNPTGGMLHLTGDQRVDRICLFNTLGQTMIELSDVRGWCRVDLTPSPDGIYFLSYQVQGETERVEKIVKR